ncbi:MAG: hypothetical protein QM619_03470 [Micropruina sp.]|uniref:putative immunity protein n=1 Tax=Micropruina sp. TaxID=2737536 RepID=UPI0039E32D64
MILPTVRDPRFITVRRGGTLTDPDHRLLALWAADCAEHVLPLFKAVRAAAPAGRADEFGRAEFCWQREQLPEQIRDLVLDDQRLRNAICWSVFDC